MLISYTGRVTMITLCGAVLSVALINGVPELLPDASPGQVAALRWEILAIVAGLIFLTGWKTNRTKVMRKGIDGRPVKGVPNTIFFVPLQYWAFFYLALIGAAIVTWTRQERIGH
jgi:hypothetical protein